MHCLKIKPNLASTHRTTWSRFFFLFSLFFRPSRRQAYGEHATSQGLVCTGAGICSRCRHPHTGAGKAGAQEFSLNLQPRQEAEETHVLKRAARWVRAPKKDRKGMFARTSWQVGINFAHVKCMHSHHVFVPLEGPRACVQVLALSTPFSGKLGRVQGTGLSVECQRMRLSSGLARSSFHCEITTNRRRPGAYKVFMHLFWDLHRRGQESS